ncbi:hypothetical protein Asi02nite_32920 [Asanoa siamensis]|uniref:Type VII secretion system protein EccE domain-containing protein n=1 Tax=Asanoa siamensis TaxID=926357 RepID=A0ABQ4CR51_9ACTN|nr:hypothetical protein Asi02nite_32920 [Asanoa siamensis]
MIEIAVLAVAAAAYALTPAPGIVAVAVVVVLLAAALARFGGRWPYEAIGARLRLARRRAGGLAAARAPIPVPATTTVADRGGATGVGRDELGWFAAVAVRAPDGLSPRAGRPLRLDWLAALAAEDAFPASHLQVVVRQSAPAPADARVPATGSYLELRSALAVPPPRDVWIAVRLSGGDARDLAADRGGGEAGVHRALTAAVSRVASGLADLGVAHTVLDGPGLRQAVAYACGSDEAGTERWSRWQARHLAHVCFAVRAWAAGHADPLEVLTRAVAAGDVSVAVTFDRGSAAARTVVRVAAGHDTIDTAVRELLAGARGAGIRLVRLDGEQAPAVYATAPTGATMGLGAL